ncbi:hypothetical protein PIB30_050038 [Stylosanthes scabra]|uniref:FAR1 domain-containing protein n=1 Tax=Stylosanthes scabra TaxID=79078 RepID=A0ABU6YGB4_9FABA|nr:hypothetical protein [Stylosanthes scabra]
MIFNLLVIDDYIFDGDFGDTDGFGNRDYVGGDSDYNPKDAIDETNQLYDEDDELPQQPGGIHCDYVEDEFYAIDNTDAIGLIEFVNLSMEKVCRYHFADIDLAFEFYQSYAKHHGFGGRRSRALRSDNKKPKAETRCGCRATMQVRLDGQSDMYYVAFFSDEDNHPVMDLRFSAMLPHHRRMSEAGIDQMNDMRKGGILVTASTISLRA